MTLLLRPCSRWCWTVPSTPASPTSTSTSPTSKTLWASLGLRSVWRNTLRHHHHDRLVLLALRTPWSPQMLVYFFYALPLLIVFIYGLRTPGCGWMLDWTIFFAGAMAQVKLYLLIVFLKNKKKLNVLLCCSSRPSGAIWEHHCTLALPSRTDSQRTSGGLLPSSTSCSPLCRLCWPCAATTNRLISWSLFPRGRPTARRRKTRRHTSTAGMRHAETRPVPSGDPQWCAKLL